MKNILFSTLALLFVSSFSFNANAQSTDEASVLKMWDAVWQAYESGDDAKVWSFYADNACEIYPDGSAACGLKIIKEGYEQFKTMMEGNPSWIASRPTVTMIGSDVALLMCDVTTDIKLKGGQQIGGKSKFAAIVHKIKGQWLIVFDSQTPVMQMPEGK
jgi:uncharacterized protein (TIGR02246 family)